jgi:outer membrane protein assembly factor BamE
MKKTLSALFICAALLSGCVYHQQFEQGNIITPAKAQSIHRGMNAQQVEAVLGSPVLKNMYAESRMTYIYTQSPTRNTMIVRRLYIDFSHDHVVNIRTDL